MVFTKDGVVRPVVIARERYLELLGECEILRTRTNLNLRPRPPSFYTGCSGKPPDITLLLRPGSSVGAKESDAKTYVSAE